MINAVLVDSREPTWVQTLDWGAMSAVTLLDWGDLHLACEDGSLLVIERKTSDDLLNTLKEDRLFPQMAGIHSVSPWAYLLVTGTFAQDGAGHVITERGSTGWSWAAVQGALLSVQELGVMVITSGGDDLVTVCKRLAARHRKPEMVITPHKVADPLTSAGALLASLPGIGLERTKDLLSYAGSAAAALAYLTDLSVNGCAGIGPSTKHQVRRALGLEDWAELGIVARENSHVSSSN